MSRKRSSQRQYAWQMDFFGGLDPKSVADRVYTLEERLGRFPGEADIIKDSDVASSPFSELLRVTDGDARHTWQRMRIKKIFSNLRIAKNGKPTHTKAFYYVQPGTKAEGKKFVPAAIALHSHPMRNQILEVAVRGYRRWVKRFGSDRNMREFLPLIETLQEKLEVRLEALLEAREKSGIGG